MRETLGDKKEANTDMFRTQCQKLVVDVFNLTQLLILYR